MYVEKNLSSHMTHEMYDVTETTFRVQFDGMTRLLATSYTGTLAKSIKSVKALKVSFHQITSFQSEMWVAINGIKMSLTNAIHYVFTNSHHDR